MSTIDANRVIFTGENSAIRLSNNDSDSFTTNATFWRAVSSGAGSGHVLYLKSELTEARWRIHSDNIAMARLLQSTVLGAIYAELLDPTIAVIDAQFSRSGDVRDFWTERLVTRDEEVVLTWYEMGEPFLVHTQPNAVPGRPYGMCTVLVPALGARLIHNGIEAQGRPWPRQREGRPSIPAFWAYARAGPRLDSVRLQTAEFGCDVCQRRKVACPARCMHARITTAIPPDGFRAFAPMKRTCSALRNVPCPCAASFGRKSALTRRDFRLTCSHTGRLQHQRLTVQLDPFQMLAPNT